MGMTQMRVRMDFFQRQTADSRRISRRDKVRRFDPLGGALLKTRHPGGSALDSCETHRVSKFSTTMRPSL